MARKIAYMDLERIRLYLGNQRIHHGALGLVVAAACALRPGRVARTLAAMGIVLAAEDLNDWRHWFRREEVPEGGSGDRPPGWRGDRPCERGWDRPRGGRATALCGAPPGAVACGQVRPPRRVPCPAGAEGGIHGS